LDQNSICISADVIQLNQIASAARYETNAEVIIRGNGYTRGCAGRGWTYRTVAVELVHQNVVIVAVNQAVATARRRARIYRVPDRDVSFYSAIGHTTRQDPAEAIVVRRHLSDYDVCANANRSDDQDSMASRLLHHSRAENLNARLAATADEIGRGRSRSRIASGRVIWIGRARDGETIQLQLDIRCVEPNTRTGDNTTADVANQLAVLGNAFRRVDGPADILGRSSSR
jgi:hypothetical protein